jgi:hypothetical protein
MRSIVIENSLYSYLIKSVERKLCTQIHCTTCGAMDFRRGINALATGTLQPSSSEDREIAIAIAQALAEIRPSGSDANRLDSAARCLVFDICGAIGERETARILGGSWGGDVLRRMQEHSRALLEARHAREEYEDSSNVRKRREEKKRIAQEKHQRRLALKKERDRAWRESHGEAAHQADEDA